MSKTSSGGIDRIDLMRTFIRIVESGNLSAAAQQMQTSQPTVSRRLQALERMLGAKLILRTTHAMKLTDDGQRCYRHAKLLIEQWSALEDDLRGDGEEPEGILRVRAPHAFGQDQLIAPLTEYLQRYGNMSVDWMLNDRTPDFIAEHIDCMIQVGEITDPSMVAVLLAEVPRIVVASPSLLAGYSPIKQIDSLARLPWIAVSTFYRNEVTLSHGESGRSASFEIKPKLSTDSLYAARKAAETGLGAAIVSAWVVSENIVDGTLVHILPDWHAKPLPVYLVYPYASYYPARLLKFLELIRTVMPELSGTRRPRN
ncbi:LysR family transcriptional regulator [Rouxiella badensis]|uniref:LysR family transcriptional regulator n=1 Tax=Rouxiella badensis TaxID=1646377 RepID=UPI00301DD380